MILYHVYFRSHRKLFHLNLPFIFQSIIIIYGGVLNWLWLELYFYHRYKKNWCANFNILRTLWTYFKTCPAHWNIWVTLYWYVRTLIVYFIHIFKSGTSTLIISLNSHQISLYMMMGILTAIGLVFYLIRITVSPFYVNLYFPSL